MYRKRKYEFESVESISVEIIMNKKKWLLIGAYKPPTAPKIESSCSHDRSIGRLSCSMFCTDLV
jgi:hypothetical protein